MIFNIFITIVQTIITAFYDMLRRCARFVCVMVAAFAAVLCSVAAHGLTIVS